MKFWRKKALLAAVEDTYGTDETPTGAANAILAANVVLQPLAGGQVSRDTIQPFMGARGDILVDTHVVLEFDVEIAGAGAAGEAPAYGALLRACGLAETIDVGTDVQYDPVSEDFESATIYVNYDGVLHRMLGARGTVGLGFAASGLPRYRFRFLGLFVAATDTALPAVDTDGFQTPLTVSQTNTPTFTIDGFAGVLAELSVELGNQVEGRFLVNAESIIVSDRQASGSARFEMPELATKDFFALARNKTRVPVILEHGTAAGNIVRVAGPTAELGRPGYVESQGIVMLEVPLSFIPDDGDDELKITVK